MILAAGLTPAWQQIMLFDEFCAGEVNRAAEVHWCASGKVLNVAIALKHLQAEVRTISLLGGLPQAAIEAEFARHGIGRQWITSSVRSPTVTCSPSSSQRSGSNG